MRINSLKSISGFSLIELVVATGVSTIVALGSGAVVLQAVKSEQKAQSVADAARAGDVLRNVVFAGSNGLNDCSNNLELNNGGANTFNAAALTSPDGLGLRVRNIPSFGGNAETGAITPFGEIVGFNIISDNNAAEFQDADGNDVISGTVYLQVRKGPSFPVTNVYLGGIGLRVAADLSFQGCAYATGEAGPVINSSGCGGSGAIDGVEDPATGGCGTNIPEAVTTEREPGAPATCPNGQAIVALDTNPSDNDHALIGCREIIEPVHCGCTDGNGDGDCDEVPSNVDQMRALTGIGAQGGAQCAVLNNVDTQTTTYATPAPIGPLPTQPPVPTPIAPLPSPTAYPPAPPTAAPTAIPPAPPASSTCPATVASANCEEICIYGGWEGRRGGDCFSYCPPVTTCNSVVILPVPTAAPTPPPVVAPPTPTPVGNQCRCGALILNEGEFCGTCVQYWEPELGIIGRSYRYIDRTDSFRCIGGSLIPAVGANRYTGACSFGGSGGIGYEYW